MNCKSNPSAVSCKECMGNAPYNYCCQDECGEHEFCRGCERYIGECEPVCGNCGAKMDESEG